MRKLLTFALVIAAGCTGPSAKELPDSARKLMTAIGAGGWDDVAHVEFTWSHLPKKLSRTYAWDRKTREVRVTIGGDTTTITDQGGDEKLHHAFVNDSYWFLFPLMILGDGSTVANGGKRRVPGFDSLGERTAVDVTYPKQEGYTGGDRYVLYLGDDFAPVAWAFHRGGQEEPTLVTTRGDRKRFGGISLPTRFRNAAGETVIEITDIAIR